MSKGFKSDVDVEGKLLASNGTSTIENAATEVYLDNTSGNYRIKTAPTKDSDLSTNDVLGWDETSERLRRIETERFEILSGTGDPNTTNEIAWYENQLYLDITDPDYPTLHRAEFKATDPDTGYTGSVWRRVPLNEKQDYLSDLVNAELSINTSTTLTIGRQHAASVVVARTYTLPAASGNTGKFISIRILATSTNLATLKGNASELIDGQNTRIMWAGESAILYCDGTGWTKITGISKPMECKISLTGIKYSIFPHATYGKVPFDQTDIDNTGLMATLGSNAITIKRNNSYDIVAKTKINNLTANTTRILSVFWIGASGVESDEMSGVSGGYPSPKIVGAVALAATNVLTSQLYQDSGATQSCAQASSLYVFEKISW